MKNVHKLKDRRNPRVYINDDYPVDVAARRAALRPALKAAKEIDPEAKMDIDKNRRKRSQTHTRDNRERGGLYKHSNERIRTPCSIRRRILSALQPVSVSHKQWCLHVQFRRANVFNFYKAKEMKQDNTAVKILDAPTPFQAMIVGKSVKTPPDWHKADGMRLLEEATDLKCSQVPIFKQLLKKNKSKTFVHAIKDPLWGCGVQLTDSQIFDQTKRQGEKPHGASTVEIIKQILMSSKHSLRTLFTYKLLAQGY